MDQTEISKLNSTLKVLLEYEKLFSEDYAQIVSAKLETLTHLINTLKEDKVLLPTWKIWSEAILIKFSYHTSSFLQLYNGTVLPYKNGKKPIIIFDEPTLIVIFRCILENYLTFFYLYLDKISEEEKEFRVLIWRYSGTKQRTEFIIQSEEAKEKQEKETAYLATLKDEIISTAFFEQFDAKRKQAILKGIKPRLFESWKSLVSKSNLRADIFQNIYGYKSNYSHSEFISILQIQQGKYGYKKNTIKGHYLVFLVHALIGKIIIDIKDMFPTIAKNFSMLSEDFRNEIIALNQYSQNP